MRETEKGRERERERERERDEERWTERKRHSNTLNVCVHDRDSSRGKSLSERNWFKDCVHVSDTYKDKQ